MRQTNQSIGQAKSRLAEILKYFREYNYSLKQIVELVSGILVDGEIRKFRGNQSKASASLGISKGTFGKILRKVEGEEL